MNSDSKNKILIIDDDIDLVKTIETVLVSNNFEVASAYDPIDGWEKIMELNPDLVLLDVMIPSGTEGFHFVWKLRSFEDKKISNTPIIVMTSIHDITEMKLYPYQQDAEYEPGEYLPVQKFLDKPIHSKSLLEAINEILYEKSHVNE